MEAGATEVANSLGSGVVHLAFDADAKHNERVARALRESYRTLKERGFEVVLETWPRELGKGIDDLLASGHEPTLLAGEDAHAAVNEIVAEATGVSRILKNAVSATELMAIEFPKPRWIVPGIVPEGTTILAGKPKMGKSWLALGTSVAVAAGGVALGTKRVETGCGPLPGPRGQPQKAPVPAEEAAAWRRCPRRPQARHRVAQARRWRP